MSAERDEKLRILVNSNSNMSRGKYAAAAVHAALTAAGVHPGLPVIVLGGQRDDVLRCATIIHDAGKTEVEPGTPTAGTDWSPTPPADDIREAVQHGPVCAWCPDAARGSAWHNDGRLHPSCGQIGHGQGWVPEPITVRPRGTVTDAEVEAAARAMSPRADRWADFSGVARTALEAAREARS